MFQCHINFVLKKFNEISWKKARKGKILYKHIDEKVNLCNKQEYVTAGKKKIGANCS